MKHLRNALITALGLITVGLAFTPAAQAGCGVYPGLSPTTAGHATYQPSAFYKEAGQLFGQLPFPIPGATEPIVGLWKIQFTAQNSPGIPDGTPVDFGYSAWHSDGTEIMNSGRPPVTGNFCLGVWKKVAHSTYKLNHYALNWSGPPTPATPMSPASPTSLSGTANIKEEVTVDPNGNSFEGPFSITFYDTSGNVMMTILGKITGQRLTVDSPGNS